MNNKLICPFCQQEAHITEWESANSEAYCPHCDTTGDLKLWQELIRTRKALDVAVDALKVLDDDYFPQEINNPARIAREQINEIKGGK